MKDWIHIFYLDLNEDKRIKFIKTEDIQIVIDLYKLFKQRDCGKNYYSFSLIGS